MDKFRAVFKTWHGWLATLGYIVFIVWSFMRDDRYLLSGSDTLTRWVPEAISATFLFVVVLYIIGDKQSRKSS